MVYRKNGKNGRVPCTCYDTASCRADVPDWYIGCAAHRARNERCWDREPRPATYLNIIGLPTHAQRPADFSKARYVRSYQPRACNRRAAHVHVYGSATLRVCRTFLQVTISDPFPYVYPRSSPGCFVRQVTDAVVCRLIVATLPGHVEVPKGSTFNPTHRRTAVPSTHPNNLHQPYSN